MYFEVVCYVMDCGVIVVVLVGNSNWDVVGYVLVNFIGIIGVLVIDN